jgi:hypothetical protein
MDFFARASKMKKPKREIHNTTKKTKKRTSHKKGAVAPEPITVAEARLVSEAHPIEQDSPAILPQQDNVAWVDLNGTAPDHPKRVPKLRSRPKREYYIFGDGPKGQGYYHITTREAYNILDRESSRKKQQQVASDIAVAQGCSGSKREREGLDPRQGT